MTNYALAAVVLAVLLQIADVVTTHIVLEKGGFERFYLLKYLLTEFGEEVAMLAKLAIAAGCIYMLLPYPHLLMALNAFYAGLIINNVLVIRRLTK